MLYRHLLKSRGLRRFIPTRRQTAPSFTSRRLLQLEPLEHRCVLSAGSLVSTFGTGGLFESDFIAGAEVDFGGAAEQLDGKIVVAGTIRIHDDPNTTEDDADAQRAHDFLVARFLANGSLDTTFGDEGGFQRIDFDNEDQFGHDVVLDPLGRILIAGRSHGDVAVVRLDSTGSVDTTFSADDPLDAGDPLDPDGVPGLAVIDLDGSLGRALALTPGGEIVVAGQDLNGPTLTQDMVIAKFDGNGDWVTTFGDSGGYLTFDLATHVNATTGSNLNEAVDNATDVAVQADGKLVVVGNAATVGVDPQFAILRLHADGTLDTTFDQDGVVTTNLDQTFSSARGQFAKSVALEPEATLGAGQKIVVAGEADRSTSTNRSDFAVARFLPNGELDTGFGTPESSGGSRTGFFVPFHFGQDVLNDVALQPDGGILLGGGANTNGAVADTSVPRAYQLMRLQTNGDPDTGFGTTQDGRVLTSFTEPRAIIDDLLVRSDGKVVAAGFSGLSTARNGTLALYETGLGLPPEADAGGPYSVPEDGSVALTGTATDPDDATGHVFEWDLDGDGIFGELGSAATRGEEQSESVQFSADGLVAGSQVTVTLRVADPRGLWHTDTAMIDVISGNSPPQIAADNALVTVDEGELAENTGTFVDTDDDEVTLTASAGSVTANQDGTWSWSLATTDGSDTQTVTITADDGQVTSSVSFDVTVADVAPIASAGGPYETFVNVPIVLDGAASDPVGTDNSPFVFDWDLDGDGTFETPGEDPTFDPAILGLTETTAHAVTLRVTDGDGVQGFATADVTVLVTGAALVDGTLYVAGTTGGEPTVVRMHKGQLQVRANYLDGGSAFFDPDLVDLISLHMGDGNDIAIMHSGLTIGVFMDGGAGNDILFGARGDDVLIGGPGNDLLWGQSGQDTLVGGEGADDMFGGLGSDVIIGGDADDQLFGGGGRDLLIGGNQSDWLWGGEEEDILIGGTTIYDEYNGADAAAIDQVMSIWTDAGTSYDQRVGQLTDSGGLLEAGEAVFNDDETDFYVSGGGRDLYFADVSIESESTDVLLFESPFEDIIEL